MELNSNKQKDKKISILNKIKHKPLLIEKIFPFTLNRPFIFPFIIDNYPLLKLELRTSYKSLKKNNKLSDEINKIFYKFIILRILYESNFNQYLQDFDYIMEFNYYFKNSSYFEIYRHIFEVIFVKKEIIEKANISYLFFCSNVPKKQGLDSFIIDYFQYHKKLYFFFPFFYDNEYKDKIKMNIEFLKKIKSFKDDNLEADILFIFNEINYDNKYDLTNYYSKFDDYFKINNIYFLLSDEYNSSVNCFLEQIYNFINLLLNGKNKNNIKKIILDKNFLKKKYRNFYYNNADQLKKNKSYLEILVKDLINEKKQVNFPSLKEISFYEFPYLTPPNYVSEYKQIFLLYNLYSFFSQKEKFNLNIIIMTPNDFNNFKNLSSEEIKNLKNKLDNKVKTEFKILVIDFENNSPYQENFIYFCNKILTLNESIYILLIRNIGKINYDIKYYYILKKEKPKNRFPNLINVIYENNKENKDNDYIIDDKNAINEFLNLFFYIEESLFISEIFLSQNNLKYIFLSKILIFNNIVFSSINLEKFYIILKTKNKGSIYKYDLLYKILYLNNTFSPEEKDISNIIEMIGSKIGEIKDINNFIEKSKIIKTKNQLFTILKGLNSMNRFFDFKKIVEDKSCNKRLLKILTKDEKNKLVLIMNKKFDIFGAYKNFYGKENDNGFVFNILKNQIYYTEENDYGFFNSDEKGFGVNNYFYISKNKIIDNEERYKMGIEKSSIKCIEIYE